MRPGTTGNGHIYYAGMDNNAGAGGSGSRRSSPATRAGIPPANPAEHTKYLTYPQTHVLSASQASYDAEHRRDHPPHPARRRRQPGRRTPRSTASPRSPPPRPRRSPRRTLFNLIDADDAVRARDRRAGDGRGRAVAVGGRWRAGGANGAGGLRTACSKATGRRDRSGARQGEAGHEAVACCGNCSRTGALAAARRHGLLLRVPEGSPRRICHGGTAARLARRASGVL